MCEVWDYIWMSGIKYGGPGLCMDAWNGIHDLVCMCPSLICSGSARHVLIVVSEEQEGIHKHKGLLRNHLHLPLLPAGHRAPLPSPPPPDPSNGEIDATL